MPKRKAVVDGKGAAAIGAMLQDSARWTKGHAGTSVENRKNNAGRPKELRRKNSGRMQDDRKKQRREERQENTRNRMIMGYIAEDIYDKDTTEQIAVHVKEILKLLGEDPEREGLVKTPERVAKSLQFLTKGYSQDGEAIVKSAIFDEEYQQMVLVKDIDLYSMCEHHMLPFIGKAHIAYIPNGKITGLSKIARVVETYARRLQVQERLTVEIRDCIQNSLHPLGVAVVIEASHTCMQIRGIQKANAVTTTSAFSGAFLTSARTRNEFLNLIK